MSKPIFMNLWNAFPTHSAYPTMKDLYTKLGGKAEQNIHAPGFGPNGNTCASRMSMAFNEGGWPINKTIAAAVGARTISTGDGKHIIFGVEDLKRYLNKTLGKPTPPDVTLPFDSDIKGKRGIIVFNVNWNRATGHIALYNGHTYREPTYDDYSRYINQSNPNIRTYQSYFWEFK